MSNKKEPKLFNDTLCCVSQQQLRLSKLQLFAKINLRSKNTEIQLLIAMRSE